MAEKMSFQRVFVNLTVLMPIRNEYIYDSEKLTALTLNATQCSPATRISTQFTLLNVARKGRQLYRIFRNLVVNVNFLISFGKIGFANASWSLLLVVLHKIFVGLS